MSLDEGAATPVVAALEPADLPKWWAVALLMRDVPTTVLDKVHRVLVGRSQAWIAALGHPLPVTFICDRPQVPKDLHEASAEMLLGALSTRST